MLGEFKSRPKGTGMSDVGARGVVARIDQPGRRDGEKLDAASRQT